MCAAPDDDELFLSEVADVDPLVHDRLAPPTLTRRPASISDREREALRELDRLVSGDAPFDLSESDEFIEGHVPGLDPRVLRQLRSGRYSIQADLDLHGCDRAQARQRVEQGIADCLARGLRCLRIVHGRGLNSPGRLPVLKTQLPRWLSRGRIGHCVLAYVTAPAHDGGAGATYVLLRRASRVRARPAPGDCL
ncbi:MAG: Smr/MutS family protein [Myxococcota bacterium]